MYRVLLVDDEQVVLRGLQQYVDWDKLGCTVVATATDGEDAYHKALEHTPDIIITDIMMPGRTGLELIRDLKPHLNAAFIIFSGYSEFSYAKEALRLETVDYLIKPINIAEIEKTIECAKRRLQSRIEGGLSRDTLDIIMESKISHLLDGETVQIEELSVFSAFAVISVQAGGKERNAFEIGKIVDLACGAQSTDRKLFPVRQKQTVHLVCCVVQQNEIYDFARKVLGIIRQEQELTSAFFWGTGEICFHQSELAASCAISSEMLHYSVFTQEQASKDMQFADFENDNYDQMIERIIHTLFKGGEEFYLEKGIENLFERMLYERLSVKAVQSVCCNLVYNCRYLAEHEYASVLSRDFSRRLDIAGIMKQKNITGLKESIYATFREIHRALSCDDRQTKSAVIRRIYAYVENNLDKPITLTDLSEFVNMNASYISHIFKKETGMNLFDFITGQKIQFAQKLIADDKLLIGEVARRVGYEDQRYFCQVFKKRVGMTAMEYREFQKSHTQRPKDN